MTETKQLLLLRHAKSSWDDPSLAELHRATAAELLERLRRVPDEVDAVMLIGHEPSIRDLAVGLVGRESELADRKFPTAGLATLTFTGPWSALAPDRAGLAAFVTPRELT